MVFQEEPNLQPQKSQLFMVRVWSEDLGGGQLDWRGKVQHMISGETRFFCGWSALEEFLEELARYHRPEVSHEAPFGEKNSV